MRSMKLSLIALAVAAGLSAEAPKVTPINTIPVGTTINITGIGSQNSSGAFQVGGFSIDKQTVKVNGLGGATQGFAAGSQGTNGSLNFTTVGTNAAGLSGNIFNEGYTQTTATQTGGGFDKDGRTGVGSTAHGILENYIKVDVKNETGTLGLGATGEGKLPAGMEISGQGSMKHGTQAILGTLNSVSATDVKTYDDAVKALKQTFGEGNPGYKDGLAKLGERPVEGTITGFTQGGFAATSGVGNFDFKANGVSPCGGGWVGGGKIDTFGNSYVNQIPNGYFSGASSTTVISVPTVPTKVNVPTGK